MKKLNTPNKLLTFLNTYFEKEVLEKKIRVSSRLNDEIFIELDEWKRQIDSQNLNDHTFEEHESITFHINHSTHIDLIAFIFNTA